MYGYLIILALVFERGAVRVIFFNLSNCKSFEKLLYILRRGSAGAMLGLLACFLWVLFLSSYRVCRQCGLDGWKGAGGGLLAGLLAGWPWFLSRSHDWKTRVASSVGLVYVSDCG